MFSYVAIVMISVSRDLSPRLSSRRDDVRLSSLLAIQQHVGGHCGVHRLDFHVYVCLELRHFGRARAKELLLQVLLGPWRSPSPDVSFLASASCS